MTRTAGHPVAPRRPASATPRGRRTWPERPGSRGRIWWCEPTNRYAVFPGQAPSVCRRVRLGHRGPADHHARLPARDLVRGRLRLVSVHRPVPRPRHLPAVRVRLRPVPAQAVPQLCGGHRRPAPDGPGRGGDDLRPAPALRPAGLGGDAGGAAGPARRVPARARARDPAQRQFRLPGHGGDHPHPVVAA